MTYYVGLVLKDKTLIAADVRVSMYQNGTMGTKDDFTKIGKISKYTYFSGAGNMNTCGKVCRYLRESNINFPEDLLKIDIEEIKKIYNEEIQRAREEIPDFEKEKGEHGYLNLSMIVAGISKEKKPIIFFMNQLDGFMPQLIKGYPSGTATNMGPEINELTDDFFRKVREDFIRLNENPEIITKLLQNLFRGISNKNSSVSQTFDVIIVDNNGKDTLKRYKNLQNSFLLNKWDVSLI